ncbi:hypothetical protein [Candidatus Hepatoplasma crinochetorum]|uniref:Uncharacterized protein n=1 Tax=Candidatus Hepatoplasma crinochetorum Av TaxID=1427984 RepID=W8GEF3_9MOLU|nr:hypothetical protein [Candidatus Hepatoplasma crinochetorum]AHK22189.1 hypothetical protein X271_00075 [Candidatus Hepatoplasma crinochetorum Av]BDV02775.1 MAG: hypothetical protein HCTKY_0690 [Candidatus Hepatoplasma crinochetorum]
MIKDLTIFSLGFISGFLVSSYNEETKEVIEYLFDKGKKYYEDLKNIIYESIKNIEELDSDWIKLNYDKIVIFLKDKLKEMNELSSFNNKIEYATQEISNLFENKESLKKIKKTINSTKNIFPKK